ncbi:MAG TPA: hypothetical protein VMZ71_04520, partial [Gemmataceae bacterium]|nr:hypothetical protein [Gemmataceae bacterium]
GGMSQPKDGAGQKEQGKSGRQPRSKSGEQAGKQPKEPDGEDDGGKEKQGNAKSSDGKTPGSGDLGKTDATPPKSSLPVDDDVAKDVWGNLPDKLRQQVTQYYKEEFMPRYADLLKQYYSSLSEKGARTGEKK